MTFPLANAGQNQTVNVEEIVNFDASSSTDNVGIVSYDWNFGDETTATGKTAKHAYENEGTYTVTLVVKDAAGNSATHSITVTVVSGVPLWIILLAFAIIAAVSAGVILLRRRK